MPNWDQLCGGGIHQGKKIALSTLLGKPGADVDYDKRDKVQLPPPAALRTMVCKAKTGNYIPEDYAEKIFDLANSSPSIEGVLCNDESSTDDELADFLVAEFNMRRAEAVKHVERREYLQRYLMPAAAR